MREPFATRIQDLQARMAESGIDTGLIEDPDNIYYLSGYWGYMGMDFGRPTVLVLGRNTPPALITPALEAEMAARMTRLDDIRPWTDGKDGEWRTPLDALVPGKSGGRIGIELDKTHPLIVRALRERRPAADFADLVPILGTMRLIKSADEIATMRQAGRVAVAMVEAARAKIAEGIPEYEIALAAIAAGTRKAAEFLDAEDDSGLFSPTIHNLQALQSGDGTCMVHRRSTVRRLRKGDPVYLCFCGVANFKRFKLGFDREFFVGTVSDAQARYYETALRAQQAALAHTRPGVPAEEVHAAAEEVYRTAGLDVAYRTGRAIGYSFLEWPQLKWGERTPLRAGMTLAVDGGITVPGTFGARVGDSIVVTDTGFEYLTDYPRELMVV